MSALPAAMAWASIVTTSDGQARPELAADGPKNALQKPRYTSPREKLTGRRCLPKLPLPFCLSDRSTPIASCFPVT
jgi:hypothetical protein